MATFVSSGCALSGNATPVGLPGEVVLPHLVEVQTRPDAEVYLYPASLVDREPLVVCGRHFSYRLGVADRFGRVVGSTSAAAYVVAIHHQGAVFTKPVQVTGDERVDARDARLAVC